jgi:two-component system chemotaxis response regulator CheB
MTTRRIDAVVIGASAGGIDALLNLLVGLPQTWRLPIVTVLHLPEGRESRATTCRSSGIAVFP